MSSLTKFAYKSAEKAFKKTPSNKKTTAVASKGRWLVIISAFVAASANDSLRGSALGEALDPQGLELRDAERRDLLPAGDEAAPVAVARRLQDAEDGWTIHEGQRLARGFRIRAFQANHLSVCKEACLVNSECGGIDFSEDGECQLGHNSQDATLLPSETFSHYDRPARDTFEGMTRERLLQEVDQLADAVQVLVFTVQARQELSLRLGRANDALDTAVQNAEELALRLSGALPELCVTRGVQDGGRVVGGRPNRYGDFGDGADSFLPFCDVSERTDFDLMFKNMDTQDTTSFNADISGWNVSAGTSFYGMFRGAAAFNQDLSGWMIPQRPDGYNSLVMYMFEGTSMSDISQCPCIERGTRSGGTQWKRYCPPLYDEPLARHCDGPSEGQ